MLLTTYYGFTVPQIIAMVVGLLVVIFIFVTIKDKINRKKAETSGDKEAVLNIMKKVVPDLENYVGAYGRWEWTTYQGRSQRTSYWYYGVAFNNERIYVVPLSCEAGDFSYSGSFCIEKKDVAIVNSKKGAAWVELYDMHQKELLSLMVLAENLKDDKYHPVNILQPDAEKAFIEWKDRWMDEINPINNVEGTGKMKQPVKAKKI